MVVTCYESPFMVGLIPLFAVQTMDTKTLICFKVLKGGLNGYDNLEKKKNAL
jgi:hypothetical protein